MMNQHGKLPKSAQVNPETGDPAKIENWHRLARFLENQNLDISHININSTLINFFH